MSNVSHFDANILHREYEDNDVDPLDADVENNDDYRGTIDAGDRVTRRRWRRSSMLMEDKWSNGDGNVRR